MKWLMWAGALVVVAVLVVFGVGAVLPVTHSAQVSGEVAGSPEEVWAVVTDVEAYPTWRSDVTRVTLLDQFAGPLTWREEGPSGDLTLEVIQWVPPRRLVTRIADVGLPFGGSWTYEIEPSATGTRVVITENGEIYNTAFRFMARFIFGYQSALETYLSQLQAHMVGAANR